MSGLVSAFLLFSTRMLNALTRPPKDVDIISVSTRSLRIRARMKEGMQYGRARGRSERRGGSLPRSLALAYWEGYLGSDSVEVAF